MSPRPVSVSSLAAIVIGAALTVAAWTLISRPLTVPPWPDILQGLAFSPYQAGQDGVAGDMPSTDEVDADLALLSGKAHAVRTYATEGVFSEIPRLAAAHDLNVTVGAWLDTRLDNNIAEIERAVSLSRERNVVRVIIGNETLLRGNLSIRQLTDYLDYAREHIAQPVSTAETWTEWLKHPELADHVDFIAVHILPYWEGIDVESAVGFVADRVDQLERKFPGKPIVIAEIGWPSEGRTRNGAVASTANQAAFLRRFLQLAGHEDYIYYLMEAFDQPWKQQTEGAVGAYWGIYDVARQAKFPFHGPVVRLPGWQLPAALSITAGAMLLCLFYLGSRTINPRGKTVLSFIVFGLATLTAWVIYDYASRYITLPGIMAGLVLLCFMLGMAVLLLAEAHEWIEAHWFSHRQRSHPRPAPGNTRPPRVSIHVPAYNEPPDMLIATLNALSVLDYPDYEVIVVDNNTQDEKTWRPVEAHCLGLGERFRFFHVDPLAGFKAGALNFALRLTDSKAEIVAIIDSDYIVDSNWLRDLVPAFHEPAIAIVQAPQDYRDEGENVFKSMCYAEYKGFFVIGMITRNDRNAIIQHGTMTLMRRNVLESVGGWAEWCITEDAELGLRILEQGWQTAYTARSYGRGLMPDTFMDYKKQRYRWAYGAVQILKRHFRQLFAPGGSRLTAGQRYHYIAGWLPWLAQGMNVVVSVLAIGWTVGMIYAPALFEVPHVAFSIFPLLFFSFNLLKMFHLYRYRLGVGISRTLAAAVAGMALSHTIGKATLHGLFTRDQPFIRTPKLSGAHPLKVAVASAYEEIILFASFMLAIFTLTSQPRVDSPDYTLWLTLLAVQGIPYGAALITSLLSACPIPFRRPGFTTRSRGTYRPETQKP